MTEPQDDVFWRSEWISRDNDVTIVLALNRISARIRISPWNALQYLYLEGSFIKIDKRNFEICWNFYRKGMMLPKIT